MILEVADIRIQPGRQAEFDAAIQHGVNTVISQAKGFAGFPVSGIWLRCGKHEIAERHTAKVYGMAATGSLDPVTLSRLQVFTR